MIIDSLTYQLHRIAAQLWYMFGRCNRLTGLDKRLNMDMLQIGHRVHWPFRSKRILSPKLKFNCLIKCTQHHISSLPIIFIITIACRRFSCAFKKIVNIAFQKKKIIWTSICSQSLSHKFIREKQIALIKYLFSNMNVVDVKYWMISHMKHTISLPKYIEQQQKPFSNKANKL